MKAGERKSLLLSKADYYNRPEFIGSDPIQIPRSFRKKEDIEIAAFMSSVIAWGQRITIINNARRMMEWMDNAPHDFVMHSSDADLEPFRSFVHRTFNGDDALAFMHALQRIYRCEGGLEKVLADCFCRKDKEESGLGWHLFKERFFSGPHLPRSRKHLPDPLKGSAAKRMNMFLRWMVRDDDHGVDFGLWKCIKAEQLYIPLDVHTGRVARRLGLLKRKQNDWRSVVELTKALRRIDPQDPVRLDFALFGMGVFEKY